MSRGLREDEVARRNLRAVQGGLPSLLPLQEGLGMKLNRLGAGLLHLGGFALLLVSVAEPTWSQVDYGGSSLVTYPSPWLLCFGQTCLKRPSSVLGEFSRAFLTLSLLFSGLLSLALLTLTLCQYQPVMLSEQQLPAAGANFVIGIGVLLGIGFYVALISQSIHSSETINISLRWPIYTTALSFCFFMGAGTLHLATQRVTWSALILPSSRPGLMSHPKDDRSRSSIPTSSIWELPAEPQGRPSPTP
ncbi:uncharacterized protein LOC119946131 isoform X1 [Tachyglossus aculeatus]|uniref:uncharacterized protein LOC119946131 isoform X1 n=1 Tax=Tachyglossus aculeatus TaxID=9261 RepID=UPI0018F5DA49|nr:uncharacterized protein LOC119946131 isoform X1 [Tachyglossus aculeatus]